MRLDLLRVAEVRCHETAELRPDPGVTAIVGPNGSGKTSLLEAVQLGTHGVGLRPAADARMIPGGWLGLPEQERAPLCDLADDIMEPLSDV